MTLPNKDTPEWAELIKVYPTSTTEQRDKWAEELHYGNRDNFINAMTRRKIFIDQPTPTITTEQPAPIINLPPVELKKYTPINAGRVGNPETQVLHLTDWHDGEITPSFDHEVLKTRVEHLFQATMRIATLHRNSYPINDLVIFITGDMVAGENVYQGAKVSTISCGARDQVVTLAFPLLTELILSLKQEFKTVTLECVRGNHGRYCLSEDSEILTAGGWKKHAEISTDDYAATYNNKSKIVEWQKIQEVTKFNYIGRMVNFDTKQISLCVTPEHKVLCKSHAPISNRTLPFAIKTAKELLESDSQHVLPVAPISGLPDYPISDDWLSLLGWLLTDGSYSSGEINIYQSKPANLVKIKRILKSLNLLFTETSRNPKEKLVICGRLTKGNYKQVKFHISSSERDKIMSLLPAKDRMPLWMWKLSDRQVNVLLDTLIDGDGTRWKSPRRSNCQMMFGKKELMDDIQSLLITHGLRVICSEPRPNQYSLSITKRQYAIIAHNDTVKYMTDYNGIVWCIQTPNGTIIVRRNGKVAITGNSREAPATSNWDLMLYDLLKTKLEQYEIKVNISNEFYKMVDIQGHRFFLVHLDQFRASQGVPWFAITKGLQSWYVTYDGFDYVVGGHFHRDDFLRINSRCKLLMGASMVTDDPFTQEVVKTSSIPCQWTFGVHKNKGITWPYSLIVDDAFFPSASRKNTVKIEQK